MRLGGIIEDMAVLSRRSEDMPAHAAAAMLLCHVFVFFFFPFCLLACLLKKRKKKESPWYRGRLFFSEEGVRGYTHTSSSSPSPDHVRGHEK